MRNVLAILIGLIAGALCNGAILKLNGTWVSLPANVDMQTPAGIAAAMPLLAFKHFVVVFLAHAVGAMVAALVATLLAKPKRQYIPLIIGGLFLIAGIMMVIQIPAPAIFSIIDLTLAYVPMAYLGYYLARKILK
jgi:hypothetical protein